MSSRTNRLSKIQLHATITNIETASVSKAGVNPDSPGKVNQDVAFHEISSNGRFVYGGVLDGHGKKGHILNHFLGAYITKFLQGKLENNDIGVDIDTMEEVLTDTFESAHMAARIDESVPAGRSGTTCVITIVDTQSGMVYTGNVGDSRSIIASQVVENENENDNDIDNGNSDNVEWRVMPLSIETTTARTDERTRIDQNEGRIDSGGNVWYGPVGIAMTRALGDAVMKRAGVIPTPEITTLDLAKELGGCAGKIGSESESECDCDFKVRILIASDGIFDVMKNEEVNIQINNGMSSTSSSTAISLQEGCEVLVEEARKKWQAGLPMDVRIDDTSVASLSFVYSK